VIDRLTLRLLNLGQIKPTDFEGGKGGLRLEPEAFKRYLVVYDEHVRSPSEGAGSPTWRELVKEQVAALRKMVMDGKTGELYAWSG
jgi:hypothetical protein